MKGLTKNRYLVYSFLGYLLFFAVARVLFLVNGHTIDPQSLGECALSLLWGIPQDLMVTSVIIFVQVLLIAYSYIQPQFSIRAVLYTYIILFGLILAFAVGADIIMYEHWEFKLDNSCFSYASSPEGAASSLDVMQVLQIFVYYIILSSAYLLPQLLIIPKRFAPSSSKYFGGVCIAWLVCLCLPINVGTSYWNDSLFLNHASTNSLYNLFSSMWHDHKTWDEQFHYTDQEECEKLAQPLYPTSITENQPIVDSLLTTQHPNILFIQLESCGAVFVEGLGGAKDVSPYLTQYIEEGISFDQCYGNSFRTDRGTVSAQNGYVSYPTTSLMLQASALDQLPSLAKTMASQGYSTDYMYGGNIEGMNKGTYLRHTGYQKLTSVLDYQISAEDKSSWGANDSLTFNHLYDLVMERQQSGKPWMITQQTISSHEPWVVDYHAFDNPILNAFAYTDHYMGKFIERIRKTPIWDNLLIVIYSDHGYLYQQTYQDAEFFHIPMIWVGGAVKHSKHVTTLMNQSDLAATLLNQLGLSHQNYPWSRDVLSADYQNYPFVYCSYPAGILFKDASGTTIYDIHAQKTVFDSSKGGQNQEREKKAKAILQYSYEELPKLIH